MTVVFNPEKHCGASRKSTDEKPNSSGVRVQKGSPCRNPKGYRTDHLGSGPCFLHLGNSNQGRDAAATERASKLLRTLGQPVPIDPQRALLSMVHWSYGRLDAIVTQIGTALEAEHPDAHLIAALKDEFADERDRMVRTAKVTIDADIAERQQKLEEADGEKIRTLFVGALDAYEKLGKSNPGARKAAVDYLVTAMKQIDADPAQGWVH